VQPPDLLLRLLEARGPSGFEGEPAALWREAARPFAEVSGDSTGNSVALVRSPAGAPRLALYGHIDEIGLIVTHADERGLLSFRALGGWNAEVLLGQRVELLTREGTVPAVISARRDPPRREDKRAVELEQLHLDVGARDRDEALALVAPGDPGVLAGAPLRLGNGRLAARALDNRLGAYVALEVARRVAEAGDAHWEVAAVATVQEELPGEYAGARTATFALEPAVGIAIDVTPATDVPGGEPADHGAQELGAGAALLRGPGADERVFGLLRETAETEGIPYCVEVTQGRSQTDADAVRVSRSGVPSGVVSIPTRYLHTPVEVCELADVEACVRLLVAFARRVEPAALAR
jgi:putative aminopeptidase FrvX